MPILLGFLQALLVKRGVKVKKLPVPTEEERRLLKETVVLIEEYGFTVVLNAFLATQL